MQLLFLFYVNVSRYILQSCYTILWDLTLQVRYCTALLWNLLYHGDVLCGIALCSRSMIGYTVLNTLSSVLMETGGGGGVMVMVMVMVVVVVMAMVYVYGYGYGYGYGCHHRGLNGNDESSTSLRVCCGVYSP